MQESRKALSELVIERSRHPRFEGPLAWIHHAGSAINPYCGDAVSVALGLDPTAQLLQAVRRKLKRFLDIVSAMRLHDQTGVFGGCSSVVKTTYTFSYPAEPGVKIRCCKCINC